MMELPNKSLLRPEEVAAYFDVSSTSIYRWIDHGLLVAEKYNRMLRIRRDSVISLQERARKRVEDRYG